MKGTDHAASEPNGLSKLSRDLNNTFKSLKYKPILLLKTELNSKKKLKININ